MSTYLNVVYLVSIIYTLSYMEIITKWNMDRNNTRYFPLTFI